MRFTNIILTLLLPLLAVAQVRLSGTYADLAAPSGVDHVVLYYNLGSTDASIEYTGSDSFRWTLFDGSLVQQGAGAETLYPSHDTGYRLYVADTLFSTYYVLDYRQVMPDVSAATLTAAMYCDETTMTLSAVLPPLAYRDTLGTTHPIARDGRFSYTTLAWNGTQWQDSIAEETHTLQQAVATQEIRLEPTLRNTSYVLYFDEWLSQYGFWNNTTAPIVLSDEYEAVAVDARPSSVTTSRDYNGKGVENEPQRPIDETTLSGSAPLEINFLANGNKPVAKFYRWNILKGSTLIAERFDEEQRYTFTENGNYQVRMWVYGDSCSTDSTVWDISVSESLLKVPNVFTPNGDGQNDEFRVVYRSLAEFHCWIYNRWGKLVYKWDDPAKGWDGTINRLPAAEGAYYYIIRARGTDANPNDRYHKVTKRKPADIGVYQLSGAINLIRGK